MKQTNSIITIIIILYQESYDQLKNCLKNINNFKIIIIDNDGNKELKKKIESEFTIYKYVLNKKNIGFSKAANQAVAIVDTPYILNFQADCMIENSDIEKFYQSFQKYKGAMLISPTFYENNEQTYNGGLLHENKIDQKTLVTEGDICVESVLGSVIFFKKDYFQKIGGFDESFFLYFVDFDFCRKILKLQNSIVQTYDIKVEHSHGRLKVKNRLKKIYIRNYHFTYDELYYYYKINQHIKIFNNLKKKILSYKIKIIVNLLLLRLDKLIYYYARISAFNKFKKLIKKT